MQAVTISTDAALARRACRLLLGCRVAALFVCLAGALWGLKSAAAGIDFPQFYMGGLMAQEREWAALYPQPNENAEGSAGYPEYSRSLQAYKAAAEAHGIPETFRFAHSPPVALALWPLSYLPYRTALIVWTIAGAICLWGATIQAGLIYRVLGGKTWVVEGVLTMGATLLPRALLACRIGNISPLVALCLGVGIVGMLRQQSIRAAFAVVVGSFAKYAPGVLILVLMVRRQWRAVGWIAGITAVAVIGTALIGGVEPFRIFCEIIWPTLQKPTLNWTSQTVWGASAELVHTPEGWSKIHTLLRILEGLMILAIGAALVVRRSAIRTSGVHAIAATVLLLYWLQLFGPVTWAHYAIYFVPVVGWLTYRAERSRIQLVAAALCVALIFVPWNALPVHGALGYVMSRFSLVGGIALLALIAAAALGEPVKVSVEA